MVIVVLACPCMNARSAENVDSVGVALVVRRVKLVKSQAATTKRIHPKQEVARRKASRRISAAVDAGSSARPLVRSSALPLVCLAALPLFNRATQQVIEAASNSRFDF